MYFIRHLLSILALPTTVVAVVPTWLLASFRTVDTRWPGAGAGAGWLTLIARAGGVALLLGGFLLFAWCVALFARVGKGTLAPWDPTSRLVAVGPYRHVRNPMISGVAAMLAGESLAVGSVFLAGWAAAFIAINHIYFLVSEEPGLARRFGDDYVAYRAAVPRWIPRIVPWQGNDRRADPAPRSWIDR